MPPPEAVMVSVAVVAVAELAADSFSVLLPLPGAAIPVGENETLTPLGRPLIARLTAEEKPFFALVVMVIDELLLAVKVTPEELAVRVKLRAGTMTESEGVRVNPAPAPVRVMV
jgi:hypothetical protein